MIIKYSAKECVRQKSREGEDEKWKQYKFSMVIELAIISYFFAVNLIVVFLSIYRNIWKDCSISSKNFL